MSDLQIVFVTVFGTIAYLVTIFLLAKTILRLTAAHEQMNRDMLSFFVGQCGDAGLAAHIARTPPTLSPTAAIARNAASRLEITDAKNIAEGLKQAKAEQEKQDNKGRSGVVISTRREMSV